MSSRGGDGQNSKSLLGVITVVVQRIFEAFADTNSTFERNVRSIRDAFQEQFNQEFVWNATIPRSDIITSRSWHRNE